MSQYAWHKARLAGQECAPVKDGDIHAGFYRTKKYVPVAIWHDEAGWIAIKGQKGDQKVELRSAPDIAGLFMQVCDFPVSRADWQVAHDTGSFPNQAPASPPAAAIGHNSGASRLEQIHDEARDLTHQVRVLHKAGGIKDQAEADRFADIKSRLTNLEKEATDLSREEGRPHFEAHKAVVAKWKPAIETASAGKREAETLVTSFLKAERERLRREQEERVKREAEARRAALAASGEVSEDQGPAPTAPKVSAGTYGRVWIRKVTTFVVTDPPAALRHYAAQETVPAGLVEAVKAIASMDIKAGRNVPGVEKREEER